MDNMAKMSCQLIALLFARFK